MQLKERFAKISAMRDRISEPFVVIRSRETSDGGKDGVLSLVARELAAVMLVDERCTLASEPEQEAYYELDRKAHEKQRAELMESRMRRELDFEALVGTKQRRLQK